VTTTGSSEIKNIYVLQHGFASVKWLLDNLRGQFPRAHISTALKDYSATREARDIVNELTSRYPSGVETGGASLILDEGGVLHARFAGTNIAGVEQTSFGLRTDWHYPSVLVCRSAAKLYFESQIIARGIIRKLASLELLRGVIGVIGLGALGGSLARQLLSRGIHVVGHDRDGGPVDLHNIAAPLGDLLAQSDLILGCSGTDVLARADMGSLRGQKLFASCSSSNVEFKSILERLPPRGAFEPASGLIGGATCTVLNGGFPINFDRVTEWELFDEILLTRKLCFEGVVQASSLLGSPPRGVMLDPAVQLRLVHEWLDRVPQADAIRLPPDLSIDFFRSRSEGEFTMTENPPYSLHTTTPGALTSMRAHTEPYDVEVAGRRIIVLPGVWSPAYDWSSLFYVENFPDVNGRSFLEIGSGTGVISVFAGLNGAARVVAVDVNEAAVQNSALNFERFGLKNAVAFVSDGFAATNEKFDVVTWNAPYHGSRPNDMLERGCADEGYRDIRAFFRDVESHLTPGGLVVFGFSESGDLPLIETLIADAGFRVKQRLSDWRQDYNCMLFVLARATLTPAEDQ
jgi:release factor glutamine methyltransferase